MGRYACTLSAVSCYIMCASPESTVLSDSYPVHMSNFRGKKLTGFLLHSQVFVVIIELSDYDIKNLIVVRKISGLLIMLPC